MAGTLTEAERLVASMCERECVLQCERFTKSRERGYLCGSKIRTSLKCSYTATHMYVCKLQKLTGVEVTHRLIALDSHHVGPMLKTSDFFARRSHRKRKHAQLIKSW